MASFASKLKNMRESMLLSQEQLAAKVGVTTRSISAYETGKVQPRGLTLKKLSVALGVASEYWLDDNINEEGGAGDAPSTHRQAESTGGRRAAAELDALLQKNMALFAGGNIDQEAKDAFFAAVTKAYWTAKEAAAHKYGERGSTFEESLENNGRITFLGEP